MKDDTLILHRFLLPSAFREFLDSPEGVFEMKTRFLIKDSLQKELLYIT